MKKVRRNFPSPPEETVFHYKDISYGWCQADVYRAIVWVVWGCDEATFRAFIDFQYGVDLGADFNSTNTFGCCVEICECNGDKPVGNVIWFPQRPNLGDPYFIGALSHECFHATEHILSARGIKFYSGEANEPFTYLLEFLVRMAWRILKAKRKNRK